MRVMGFPSDFLSWVYGFEGLDIHCVVGGQGFPELSISTHRRAMS